MIAPHAFKKKKILIDTSNPEINIKPEKKTIHDETNGPYIEYWFDKWPERKFSEPKGTALGSQLLIVFDKKKQKKNKKKHQC